MRISYWSSDVCSSDLHAHRQSGQGEAKIDPRRGGAGTGRHHDVVGHWDLAEADGLRRSEERRVGKECVSSVDLGGRRIIKKKKQMTISCEHHARISSYCDTHLTSHTSLDRYTK